ncbi:MAG TPA: sugar ABC transporter permease [Thermoplasmata archaeon]|nr:sugar ABC transporter permease [Thermoplasmata archaeon]
MATFFQRHQDQLIPFLFVLPALAYVGAFAFYPTAQTIQYSFQTRILSFTFYNYQANVQSGLYSWIGNTLWLTAAALTIQFVLALAVASILNRTFRGKTAFATIAILPIGIATVVAGYTFNQIFPGTGAGYANSILNSVGIGSQYWLNQTWSALLVVAIADSWKNTSLVIIILVAGYATIPRTLYQAAAIDGAGPLRQFRYVTLPGLRSFIVMALLIRGAQEVNIFQLAYIMIGQYPQLLTVQIYSLWESSGGIPYLASAVSTVLLGIVSILIVVVIILGGRK